MRIRYSDINNPERLNQCRRYVDLITCELSMKEYDENENESNYFTEYGMGINKTLIIHG